MLTIRILYGVIDGAPRPHRCAGGNGSTVAALDDGELRQALGVISSAGQA